MTDPMAMLAERYAFNVTALRGYARDLEADDWARRVEGANPPHWILGHIAHYRRRMGRMLGLDLPEVDWEKLVAKGSHPDDLSGYPTPDALVAELKEHDAALGAAMQALPEARRQEHWATFAGRDHTIESGLSFLLFHETLHLGQLSMLRRILKGA